MFGVWLVNSGADWMSVKNSLNNVLNRKDLRRMYLKLFETTWRISW